MPFTLIHRLLRASAGQGLPYGIQILMLDFTAEMRILPSLTSATRDASTRDDFLSGMKFGLTACPPRRKTS